MKEDIGKIINECLNNSEVNRYFMKKREMTFDEKKLQESNFSKMIGYCILFSDSDGIEEYMTLTTKEQKIRFLKLKTADKLGIPHDKIKEKAKDIIDYAFENFIKNGYVFHAGNSKAIDNNMKYGLKSEESSEEERMELMRIASIYAKYGSDNPLGWGTMDIKNGKTGWFYDGNPSNMLYYANSPEWFGQFCGENHCYAWGLVNEEMRHGYANRDYNASLISVIKLIEKNNMNEEDKKEIIDFFNKCWNRYGNTKPYLSFVPIESILGNVDTMKNYYYPLENDFYTINQDEIFEDIIKGGCSLLGYNICCYQNIEAENLSYVNLSPILPTFKIEESRLDNLEEITSSKQNGRNR